MVVLDATPESPTFGQIVNVTYTPTFGNEPHHVGLSNNSFLAVGGIQSYLQGNPDIYIFNVSYPAAPVLLTTVDPPNRYWLYTTMSSQDVSYTTTITTTVLQRIRS